MERQRTEYFCDQCWKKIKTEHDQSRDLLPGKPTHIRVHNQTIQIQKPRLGTPVPIDNNTPEILDFCSCNCLSDYITLEWSKAWLDQINEERRELRLSRMKIGPYGFLERVEEETTKARGYESEPS